ncbi:FtsB family cell division protein [Paenibacillus taiwanensis]|uniref:FtsB family cell division protein n=1 Tax=Paenibacillus taiwanensis TaxID=401638 RepID=UPI001FE08775|nr:septum formation initiator family protein [Paenibacillus taiwanensis]
MARHSTRTQSNATSARSVRKGTKRRLQIWLLFMLVFMGWGVYTYVSQMFQMQDLKQEYVLQEKEKREAEQARNNLLAEVNRLNTTEYILDLARIRGMVLPNEKLIRKHDE